MGTGRFKNGQFDLTVVANFTMAAGDWTAWERTMRKASELFWNASEGQIRFGKIFVADDSAGIDAAEMILHDQGDPSYGTRGQFGQPGQALHLMPYVTTRGPLTILHEMGHHVWNLDEEYSAPLDSDVIDVATPAPDNSTIPIVDSGRAVDELVGKDALLKFNDLIERRAITANTATTVTVNPGFPDLPTNNDYASVYYQAAAECSDVGGSNYCIMENSRDAAGFLNNSGVWVPAANPVTEFCAMSNHDPDSDSAQEARHGKSCWETIVDRAEFATLTVPDPASGAQPAAFVDLDWIVLDKQPRFSLVLDRSGSMASGAKMQDARHGAIYWLEFCALADDLLSIHWYDNAIEDILADLTQVSTLANLQPQKDAINALTPRGSTNIRDGLYRALDAIEGVPTRAAVQVALLLTDGRHNTPVGSLPTEVLPAFQEGGVRIYSLGVGTPDQVDMGSLDALGIGTGGRSYAVGDDQPGEVEAAMVEINAEVRGGIITTQPALFPDSKRTRKTAALDRLFARYNSEKTLARARPSLGDVLKLLNAGSVSDIRKAARRLASRLHVTAVWVEQGAERVSFSLVFPEPGQVWLYLIDPSGSPYTGPRLQHVVSGAPHEFAVVTRPKPGRWHMVAVRTRPGAGFTLRAVAGVENRHINVYAGARIPHVLGGDVGLWASARSRHELSGLRVTAEITAPNGSRYDVVLDDTDSREPESGCYTGTFTPVANGRHRGRMQVENLGQATIASPLRLERHGTAARLDTSVPRFVRQIPFYFDVGERPPIKPTDERPSKEPIPRRRRVTLVSAPRRTRGTKAPVKRKHGSRRRGSTR
jgi:hypothetical protein